MLKIVPAAVLLLWAVRIFLRKDIGKSQLLMSAGMAVASYAIFQWEESSLFVFPFVYLSFRESTSESGISKWDWLVFIPSLVFLTLGEEMASDIFLCVQIAAVLIVSAAGVMRHKKLSAEYYDTGNDAAEVPGQALLLLIAATITATVLTILPTGMRFYELVTVVLTLFLTVMLYLLGANVNSLGQQPQVPVETEPTADTAPATVPGAGEADRKLLQKAIDEKMFLDPTISLISMAENLHTNRTYLSNSIHACYNQNFSDFINHLRIGYAVDLMKKEGSGANIKDIATRSGYYHLQSFYRNFTQIMDMTPRTWMSKQE